MELQASSICLQYRSKSKLLVKISDLSMGAPLLEKEYLVLILLYHYNG